MRKADKDILELLAALEFGSEMNSHDVDGTDNYLGYSTTLRRLSREAGYSIPQPFDWQHHLKI